MTDTNPRDLIRRLADEDGANMRDDVLSFARAVFSADSILATAAARKLRDTYTQENNQ